MKMTKLIFQNHRARMKHNLNPVMNAQLDRNRRIRTHRRNLSDPRFSTSLTDSLGGEEDVRNFSLSAQPFFIILFLLQLTYGGRPYSSLALRDYDPLSDTLGMDQSRSYLGGRSLSGGAASSLDGHLRDTAITGGDPYDDRSRFLASRRFVGRCRAVRKRSFRVDKKELKPFKNDALFVVSLILFLEDSHKSPFFFLKQKKDSQLSLASSLSVSHPFSLAREPSPLTAFPLMWWRKRKS